MDSITLIYMPRHGSPASQNFIIRVSGDDKHCLIFIFFQWLFHTFGHVSQKRLNTFHYPTPAAY
jgi:hypothetical protein